MSLSETVNSVLEPSPPAEPETAPHPEDTADRYGLDVEYDFITSDYLDGGVAATAKIPEVKEIEGFQDFVEYDDVRIGRDGKLYGRRDDSDIGFVADRIYSDLDWQTGEHVNLHEAQHFIQYDEDQRWGEALDQEYDLSDELTEQLNQVDRLMDLKEHPIYRHTVNDAEVTALVEGYTERVTQAMQENGEEIGRGFYPGYTQLADNMMRQNGIDPDREFS